MTTAGFAPSLYVPVAFGFFGLATGYIIWGGQALFNLPLSSPEVDRTMAMWGFWMPGMMQLITGISLLVGITWFQVFTKVPAHYMAALAFTAFGIHWFALAHRRYIGSNPTPEGWMAIPFLLLSILGVLVFAIVKDYPVMIVFIGLALIYATEFLTRFGFLSEQLRLGPVWQLLTGIWLLYMTFGVTLNIAVGAHWWI